MPRRFERLKAPRLAPTLRAPSNAKPRALPTNSTAWRAIRADVLRTEPLCRVCAAAGRKTVATDVDHVDGDPGNNRAENLQPLCRRCHSRKTAREDGGFGNRRRAGAG